MSAVLLEIFYDITGALLVPVMVLLLGLFASSLVGAGVHLAEMLQRRRARADRNKLTKLLEAQGAPLPEGSLRALRPGGFVERFLDELRAGVGTQAALDLVEDAVARRVGRAALLVRIGPTLGLMGTLIPMGPALRDLAGGDVEGMADKLIIAFSTTVLGLAIGALAMLIAAARRRWYSADLRLCDLLGGDRSKT